MLAFIYALTYYKLLADSALPSSAVNTFYLGLESFDNKLGISSCKAKLGTAEAFHADCYDLIDVIEVHALKIICTLHKVTPWVLLVKFGEKCHDLGIRIGTSFIRRIAGWSSVDVN